MLATLAQYFNSRNISLQDPTHVWPGKHTDLPTVSELKVKGGIIALNESPFQCYRASPAVWDPTMLPAT